MPYRVLNQENAWEVTRLGNLVEECQGKIVSVTPNPETPTQFLVFLYLPTEESNAAFDQAHWKQCMRDVDVKMDYYNRLCD